MSGRRFTGSSAWEQMIGQQMHLLARFDEAKRQARGHEVQTFHGRVAEATFREWLGNFLPKRYGVTSGYVVAQHWEGPVQFPHYDVIIYDQLESPILWIEDSADLSERGKSRAIPVEYVRGVLEVKATYGSSEAKDAMEHLRDLAPFYADVDPEGERYKRFLRRDFFCGVVFFDSTIQSRGSVAAREHLKPIDGPRFFYGGTVLRCCDIPSEFHGTSGTIRVFQERTEEGLAWNCLLLWGDSCFSRFGFDIVAMLNGSYHPGMISSRHVLPPVTGPRLKPNKNGVIDIKDPACYPNP